MIWPFHSDKRTYRKAGRQVCVENLIGDAPLDVIVQHTEDLLKSPDRRLHWFAEGIRKELRVRGLMK
jgi:hypothetical protein